MWPKSKPCPPSTKVTREAGHAARIHIPTRMGTRSSLLPKYMISGGSMLDTSKPQWIPWVTRASCPSAAAAACCSTALRTDSDKPVSVTAAALISRGSHRASSHRAHRGASWVRTAKDRAPSERTKPIRTDGSAENTKLSSLACAVASGPIMAAGTGQPTQTAAVIRLG